MGECLNISATRLMIRVVKEKRGSRLGELEEQREARKARFAV